MSTMLNLKNRVKRQAFTRVKTQTKNTQMYRVGHHYLMEWRYYLLYYEVDIYHVY